ncbi:MAG: pyridoxal-dependent decarboxylase, partial [candidate division NC10 bacterium]
MQAHASIPDAPKPNELSQWFVDPRSSNREAHRRLGHRVVDLAIDHLSTLASGPVWTSSTPDTLNLLFSEPLPRHGMDPETVLAECLNTIMARSMGIGHPRHLGHMDGPPLALAIFGDLIASALNQNLLAWELAPAATHVERQVIRWLAEIVGLGPDAGGSLASGGTEANLTALWAARNLTDARHNGTRSPLVFFASDESHLSLEKAADLLRVGLIKIRTDDDGTM